MKAVLIILAALAAAAPKSVGVKVEVCVQKEVFTPGVYAAYAEEFLGLKVGTESASSVAITSLKAIPAVKAEVKCATIREAEPSPVCLPFVKDSADVAAQAEEAAKEIENLRETRFNIVSGNTDATYSGEALGAAVKYLSEREAELLRLFTGSCETFRQSATYFVMPETGNEAQRYIVFRLSAEDGLLDAYEFKGDPWYLDVNPLIEEEEEAPEVPADTLQVPVPELEAAPAKKGRGAKDPQPARPEVKKEFVPAKCSVSLTNGRRTALHLYMEIPQLGKEIEIK